MNKSNIIKSILLALPIMMATSAANAEASNCEEQFDACDKLFESCGDDDQQCWERGDACFMKIEDSCFEDDFSDDEDEVEIDDKTQAAIEACDKAYEACVAKGESDCETKLQNCVWGEDVSDVDGSTEENIDESVEAFEDELG